MGTEANRTLNKHHKKIYGQPCNNKIKILDELNNFLNDLIHSQKQKADFWAKAMSKTGISTILLSISLIKTIIQDHFRLKKKRRRGRKRRKLEIR